MEKIIKKSLRHTSDSESNTALVESSVLDSYKKCMTPLIPLSERGFQTVLDNLTTP